jgi:hypothetical protein
MASVTVDVFEADTKREVVRALCLNCYQLLYPHAILQQLLIVPDICLSCVGLYMVKCRLLPKRRHLCGRVCRSPV